jgi:hypothetical protein
MIPMWFFIVLISLIVILLYLTRTTEDDFIAMGKNSLRKFQYWFRQPTDK